MSNSDQEEFKNLFNAKFTELIGRGLTSSEAAAQALIDTQQSISEKNKKQFTENDIASNSSNANLSVKEVSYVKINPIKFETIFETIESCKQIEDYSSLVLLIKESFSSIEVLNQSFSMHSNFNSTNSMVLDLNNELSKDEFSPKLSSVDGLSTTVFKVNPVDNSSMVMKLEAGNLNTPDDVIDISLDEVAKSYSLIYSLNNEIVIQSLNDSIEIISNKMKDKMNEQNSSNSLKYLIIMLENPSLNDPSYDYILQNIFHNIDKLSLESKYILSNWMASISSSTYLKYIALFRQYVTLKIYMTEIDDARIAVKSFGSILHSSLDSHPSVSLTEFYNDALNEDYMVSPAGKPLIKSHRSYL
jgi:ubiquitin-protein ligase E3 A